MSKKKTNDVKLFGTYGAEFELLEKGKTVALRDKKSERNSYVPVRISDEKVYMSKPDGKLIPEIEGQGKCDYLLYCENQTQACYMELKGTTISKKETYNPYDQIRDTMRYLRGIPECQILFQTEVVNHAFIVSPERQNIPKGINIRERALLQELIKYQKKPEKEAKISDYIHYVKVTPSDRYSDKNGRIICSPANPVTIPYGKL